MTKGSLSSWFGIRPGEGRPLVLSIGGAFLIIAILILGRALREAAFLGFFEIEKLPYMTAAVAAFSFPLIAVITRLSKRWRSLYLLRGLIGIQALGLIAFVLLIRQDGVSGPAITFFFLWTALGSLLIASGFWLVVSESFVLRGAKRLFGLISAGGTVGALATGFTLKALSTHLAEPLLLAAALVVLLSVLLVLLAIWPKPPEGVSRVFTPTDGQPTSGGLSLILKSRHLRLIAFMVMSATLASTLLDYQFKEAVRSAYASSPEPEAALAGFFGAFYGWVGAVALLIQLTVASRLIASLGIGRVLLVLPVVLMVGSAIFGFWPALLMITLVKGADGALRKSVFRPMVEILYLPVDLSVRRRTKALIDTALDTLSEGLGAGFIVLWVTVWSLPSRFLAGFVLLIAVGFILLSRRMDREYLRSVIARLHEEEDVAVDRLGDADNMLSAGFSFLGINSMVLGAESSTESPGPSPSPRVDETLRQLRSNDPAEVRQGLKAEGPWSEVHFEALIGLLARPAFLADARAKLLELGDLALPSLSRALRDEMNDLVVRRRIPWFLSFAGGPEIDQVLLETLTAQQFELRYRAAVALTQRRKRDLPNLSRNAAPVIWEAVRFEITRSLPVWELQKLGDDVDTEDEFILDLADRRGRRSLEHTFRLLSLVLDADHVRAAYRGVVLQDAKLRNYSLEYLEQVLPVEIKKRLWLLVGDSAPPSKSTGARPIQVVIEDLVSSSHSMLLEQLPPENPAENVDPESGLSTE